MTAKLVEQLPAIARVERALQSAAIIGAVQCDGTRLSRNVRAIQFFPHWRDDARLGRVDNWQGDFFGVMFTDDGVIIRGRMKDAYRVARDAIVELNIQALGPGSRVPQRLRKYERDPQVSSHGFGFTFCIWRLKRGRWQIAEALLRHPALETQEVWGLDVLMGEPGLYQRWATRNYGVELPIGAITAILDFTPLTPALAEVLGAKRSFEEIAVDANEIGYPVAE